MNKPLLSVVIANYNYGRFLEAAIQSVVSQNTDDQVEVIICDAASTDNSVEVIRKYADKIAWWCSEKDKGQSDAFNKGFSHAKGRYGCWLNADDVLMPGAIKVIINYLTRHPECEWLAGSTVFTDSNLRVWKCSRCVRVWPFLGRFAPAAPVNGPSSIFLLSNLFRMGGFDINAHYTMDVDLWRRFWQWGIKLHFIDDYLWGFRLHEESKTSSTITEHRVKDSVIAEEGDKINVRYGVTRHARKIADLINRFQRLISGRYLWSYLDTRKYKGFSYMEVLD